MQNLTINFFNVHEISWLAEELLANEGLCPFGVQETFQIHLKIVKFM